MSAVTPGCTCPPSYVRDVCAGHTEEACQFNGMFGLELAAADYAARHPNGQQLTLGEAIAA